MKYKYPRTSHVPWSQGCTAGDKKLVDMSCFLGKAIVVTEKMDGENTTIGKTYTHARSLDSGHHESRNWVKQFAAQWQHLLDDDIRVCGENLYAKHSILYTDLPSYFLGFSVWKGSQCLNWGETQEIFKILGIESVKVISCYPEMLDVSFERVRDDGEYLMSSGRVVEGYVIRNWDSFHYSEFSSNVAKFVRKHHVQTDSHWMHGEIVKNQLA